MEEQLTTAQKQDKTYHPLSPYPNPNMNEPPPNLSIPESFLQ